MSTHEQPPQTGLDEYMPALAAEFVQTCKDAGINLDFQPRTLPLVDKFLAGARRSAKLIAAKDPQALASTRRTRCGLPPTSAKSSAAKPAASGTSTKAIPRSTSANTRSIRSPR